MYTNFCPSNTIRSVERYGISSTPCPGKGTYNSNSGKCETPPKDSACPISACTFSSAPGFTLVISKENNNAVVCQKDPIMDGSTTVSVGSPVTGGTAKSVPSK